MLRSTVYQQREDASPAIGDRYVAVAVAVVVVVVVVVGITSNVGATHSLRIIYVTSSIHLDRGVELYLLPPLILGATHRARRRGGAAKIDGAGVGEGEQKGRDEARPKKNTKHHGEDAPRTPAPSAYPTRAPLGIGAVVNGPRWP